MKTRKIEIGISYLGMGLELVNSLSLMAIGLLTYIRLKIRGGTYK